MKSFFRNIIVAIITYEAKILLRRMKPCIIAVTGSVGKTSIKDAIYEVLKKKVYIRKSEKSFNSEIGVPLSILGLPSGWDSPFMWLKNILDGAIIALHPGKYPDVLVLEMGVDRPGDMDALTAWIKPDIVVLTRLPDVPVHVEFFESPEAIIHEKRKLVDALKPDGVLVFNQDDEKVAKVAQEIFQKSIGYSRYARAPFVTSSDSIVYEHGKPKGVSFTLSHLEEKVSLQILGTIGVPQMYTAAASAAVASIFEVPLQAVADAFSRYAPPGGRMRIIEGIKDTIIIDDTYNASPIAAQESLRTLKEVKGVKRRIAVLGDMMELGQFSIREHEHIGKLAAQSADILVTIGVRARGFSKGALEEGMNPKNIFEFETAQKAGQELQNIIKAGDIILVKASQSIRAERFVEEIMAEPDKAPDLLVRQGKVWKER